MYIHGGCRGDHIILEDLWALDLGSLIWTHISVDACSVPPPLFSHSLTAVDDHRLILLGGCPEHAAGETKRCPKCSNQHTEPTPPTCRQSETILRPAHLFPAMCWLCILCTVSLYILDLQPVHLFNALQAMCMCMTCARTHGAMRLQRFRAQ